MISETRVFLEWPYVFGRDGLFSLTILEKQQICMKFSPEMCHKPRNNWFDFENDLNCNPDLDYDPDLTDLHEPFIRFVSLAKGQSIKLWE